MSHTVVIADDHAVIREALRALLTRSGEWEVIGEARDGLEVVPLVEQLAPDIVVMDLSMPNLGGIEALGRIAALNSRAAVLILTARTDDHSVRDALKAGAKGFLPKSADAEELKFALDALLKGQTYLSPSVSASVVNRTPGEENNSPLSSLSSREREVMKLLCEGNPNREVAKILHISPRTVDTHRTNILKKLNLESNAEMVQLALKYGMIE